MKKIFEKYEFFISMCLIIIYLVLNSFCMQNWGLTSINTVVCNALLSACIIIFINKIELNEYLGLVKPNKTKEFLYFFPLVLMVAASLISGIYINNSSQEILFHVLSMICIGFLEEIIFRGFLFKMMEKDNVKSAIIVTSITFGIGHIINLFNGAELIPTLIQITYAIAAGFLFVIIFYKGKSLLPCIITHICVNSLSIISVENDFSLYTIPILWLIISISYSIYIIKKIK